MQMLNFGSGQVQLHDSIYQTGRGQERAVGGGHEEVVQTQEEIGGDQYRAEQPHSTVGEDLLQAEGSSFKWPRSRWASEVVWRMQSNYLCWNRSVGQVLEDLSGNSIDKKICPKFWPKSCSTLGWKEPSHHTYTVTFPNLSFGRTFCNF